MNDKDTKIDKNEEIREKYIRADTEAAACIALFAVAMVIIGVFL